MATPGVNVKQLSARVIRVMGLNPGPMTLDGTNTYLVGTGSSRILIDTGEGKPNYPQLLKQCLHDNRVDSLSHVLITHRHPDHIGGLGDLVRHQLVTPEVTQIGKFIHHESKEDITAISKYFPQMHSKFDRSLIELKHGDVFQCQGATLRVIYTPGHTNDHVTLYLEEENAWFSADCVLGRGSTTFEDLKSYMDSLKMIQEVMQNTLKRIYPAHGEVIEDGPAKVSEYLRHREERELQILDVIERAGANGQTLTGIVKSIYPELGDNPRLFRAASHNVSLHISKLLTESKIASSGLEHFTYHKVTSSM